MNILTTTGMVTRAERPSQGIDDIRKAGFDDFIIDASMYLEPHTLMRWNKLLTPEKEQWIVNDIAAMKTALSERGITPRAVLLPYASTEMMRSDYVEVLTGYCKMVLREFEDAGIRRFIARPLTVNMETSELDTVNRDYYLGLLDECKCEDTQILLVNACRSVGGHLIRGMFTEPEQAITWLTMLNERAGKKRFGFCCDIGTYTLAAVNLRDTLKAVGEYVDMVLLRDNDGKSDKSIMMFFGQQGGEYTTDLLGLIRGLREIGFDKDLIIDASTSIRLCPAMLWPQYMKFEREIAGYIQWQIELETSLYKYDNIVLFGAGNMCRAFMKAYGDRVHPLFTCDNNPDSWGTVFEGLEVKSAEALLDLPENTGVYICNMYYTQIEAQLKEMGIANIEFFNDEYLPTYHEQRIDRNKKVISE